MLGDMAKPPKAKRPKAKKPKAKKPKAKKAKAKAPPPIQYISDADFERVSAAVRRRHWKAFEILARM